MMNILFRIGRLPWARTAVLAGVATGWTGAAAAQSVVDVPLPEPSQRPATTDDSLQLGPGEMLLDPESIPPELRPKFPENPPHGEHGYGMQQPCSQCGNPGCGGTCAVMESSCGTCESGYVGRFDALYMTNDSADGVTLSNQFQLDEFDYELGGRLQLRREFDCVNGYEAVFTMIPEWEVFAQTPLVVGGTFDSLLTPIAPVVAADLDTFNDDGNQHFQAYRAEYTSFEANRTYNGWDVASTLIGLRVIQYDEEYQYSTDDADGVGVYRQNTDNLMIGLQGGLNLDSPLSRRLWSTVRLRGGVFADFADAQSVVVNDFGGAGQTTVVNSDEDDIDIAGMIEIGTGLRYDVGRFISLYGGYELWYLTGVATASSQLDVNISPQLGNQVYINDEVLMHGLSVGARVNY